MLLRLHAIPVRARTGSLVGRAMSQKFGPWTIDRDEIFTGMCCAARRPWVKH